MHAKIKEMYVRAKMLNLEFYKQFQEIEAEFNLSNLAGKVDTVYGLQKTSEMLTDIRKQIDKLEKRLGLHTCMVMEFEQVHRLKTDHCSAGMKIEQFINLPHKREKDPEKFDRLMGQLGVPSDISEHEVVRFHWPAYKEWFSKRQADGEPLPIGVDPDDVYAEYSVQTRKVREPDE